MRFQDFKHGYYERDTFVIKKKQKGEGMSYAVAKMNKEQLKATIECADLTTAAYPIPRNLRERLENILLPRLYEIQDEIKTNKFLPEILGIELSKLNQEDILYGLESTSIQKLLKERGYKPEELKEIFYNIYFIKFKN